MITKKIGNIEDEGYCEISIKKVDGKYYWTLDKYVDINCWEEITKDLFDALNKFEDERKK